MVDDDQALSKLVQKLVKAPIGSSKWRNAYDKAKNIIRFEKVTSISQSEVNSRFNGLVEKFSIIGNQRLSESLEEYKAELFKTSRSLTTDEEHNTSLKYDILHLLLALSSSENQDDTTIPKLNEVESETYSKDLTWEDIIQDDPLEGDHWKTSLEISSNDGYITEEEIEYEYDYESKPDQCSIQQIADDIQLAYPIDMDIDERADQEGLNMLVSQQYWRHDYHLEEDSFTEPKLLRNPCQTYKAAEWFRYGNTDDRENRKLVTEASILREVLSLFKGYESVIFIKRNDKLVCNEEFATQHISQGALKNLLKKFCSAGNMLQKLRQHSMENIHITSFGKTNQAFARTVYNLLNDFDRTISKLEGSTSFITDDASKAISLLKLQYELEPHLQYFKDLYDIIEGAPYENDDCCALSVYLICTLYEQALTCQSFQQLKTFNVIVDVMKETIAAYSRLMDEWIFNGTLAEDAVGEFFVSRNAAVHMDSPDFWSKGYTLKTLPQNFSTHFKNPLFSEIFLNQVFFTGKAVSLLLKLHKMVPDKVQPTYRPFSEIMSKVVGNGKQTSTSPLVRHQQTSENRDIFTLSLFPLADTSPIKTYDTKLSNREETASDCRGRMIEQELSRCVKMYIESPYMTAANMLNETLHKKGGLQNQMKLFASIYFMLENNLMHSFCQTLFEQMDNNNEVWFDQRILNRTFRETCDLNGYQETAFLELNLGESSDDTLNNRNGYKSMASKLELITFHVEIPWPLNNFIHADCLLDYSKVQRFLLRLKRAKYVLEKKTLFRDMKIKSDKQAMYFYSLRMKMIWLINSFWRYIMTTILHAETIEYRNRLSVLKDADEITALHDAYVRRIVDRCLLNDKATAIRKSLVSIFDLAEQMAILFKDYLEHTDPKTQIDPNRIKQFDSTIKNIEKSFNRSNDFIATSLTIMGRKANMPWFEALGLSLSCQVDKPLQ
ncbi:Spc98 family-domain-containing protein [Mycotypha africana]|uniref:Spc98 family-domain-containing protein n=1 Tax=Mycotypha africana TaxID=64632 RepID=UPI002301E981|nr:Spc98 family-domain-containing protein [Mycotypha africana]KAI8979370.1 Spc98 family-domain-containing protein [Mycotypha africana]